MRILVLLLLLLSSCAAPPLQCPLAQPYVHKAAPDGKVEKRRIDRALADAQRELRKVPLPDVP